MVTGSTLQEAIAATTRQHLIQADPLAYHKPLYQVLALPEDTPAAITPATAPRSGQARSVGDILRQALEGGRP